MITYWYATVRELQVREHPEKTSLLTFWTCCRNIWCRAFSRRLCFPRHTRTHFLISHPATLPCPVITPPLPMIMTFPARLPACFRSPPLPYTILYIPAHFSSLSARLSVVFLRSLSSHLFCPHDPLPSHRTFTPELDPFFFFWISLPVSLSIPGFNFGPFFFKNKGEF